MTKKTTPLRLVKLRKHDQYESWYHLYQDAVAAMNAQGLFTSMEETVEVEYVLPETEADSWIDTSLFEESIRVFTLGELKWRAYDQLVSKLPNMNVVVSIRNHMGSTNPHDQRVLQALDTLLDICNLKDD